MSSWFESAAAAARPTYKAILELPFIRELIDGTLPREKFNFYLQQDSLYLRSYSQTLAHIASRVPTQEMAELFLSFAGDCVAVERGMHASYLADCGPAREMTPTCMLYTSVQRAQAVADVAVEAASVLPCFKVYLDCGLHILDRVGDNIATHPYREWISTYADPAFTSATEKAIAACEALAGRVSGPVRDEMTNMYVLCTRLEYMFWQSAYDLERWKI